MKSSTAKLQQSSRSARFGLTREQAEKIAAVEGMVLSERMKRIVDLPISDEEQLARIKALAHQFLSTRFSKDFTA